MYHIKESIEIIRPAKEVFQFLREIQPRLKLSPSYRLIELKKISPGPISKGSRYYESEVIEIIESEKIATRW